MTVYTIDQTPVAHWDDSENYVSYEDWKKAAIEAYGYRYFEKGDTYDPDLDARIHLTQEYYEDDLQFFSNEAWHFFLSNVQRQLYLINLRGMYWHVSSINRGWRHLSGETVVKTNDASEWLRAILPNTDYTLAVYTCTTDDNRQALRLVCSHHDAMGEEYYCVPMTEEEENDNEY